MTHVPLYDTYELGRVKLASLVQLQVREREYQPTVCLCLGYDVPNEPSEISFLEIEEKKKRK